MVKKEEFYYDSSDNKTKIQGIRWIPENQTIIGILQIAHGMVEFIDRYDEFARVLAENGFLVVGNDHLGHGNSVLNKTDWGFFSEQNGAGVLLEDMHLLLNITKELYPRIPYFLLGHSMGSFLTRQFITVYGNELKGAIIVGTGCQPYIFVKAGQLLSVIIAKFKGWRYRSGLIDYLALGSNNKRFEPGRTPKDWLSRDIKIVDAYLSDERNNFVFTLNAYKNMFDFILYLYDKRNLVQMPKALPLLIISGKDDPVGDFGKGVLKVYESFNTLGMEAVSLKLYEGYRHEIINETGREIVYNDIIQWLYKYIK